MTKLRFSSSGPLSIIERPRCAHCQRRMEFARNEPGRGGFEFRTFECTACDHVHTMLVASDPMKSNAMKWANSSLRPPT